ncbi:MAG TPA: hypothetical protein GX506_02420, partial [Firmicutes bacterium]|nr:hypothetical protein [Bacillota bacterium]
MNNQLGYLGPPGSFCEEAATRLQKAAARLLGAGPLAAITLIPQRTIREAIGAVESGELSAAVVPIENSIEGSVSETLDSLIHSTSLLIQGEIVIPVSHNLMIWTGGPEDRPRGDGRP